MRYAYSNGITMPMHADSQKLLEECDIDTLGRRVKCSVHEGSRSQKYSD
jgi:hypothetical protein